VTAPLFDRVRLRLGSRTLTIEAPSGAVDGTRYVASARLNGRPLRRAWIRHDELARGGTLALRLSPTPTSWASGGELPPSLTP
jgi:putative alpha-1,2-mannosidase